MAEPNEPLSEREQEILRLVATGAPNKEIARQLVISPNTVKVHLRNIFTKIGVTSRTEATLYAVQMGLVTPGATQNLTIETEEENAEVFNTETSAPLSDQALNSSALPREEASHGPAIPERNRAVPQRVVWIAIAALVLVGLGMFAISRWGGPAEVTLQVTQTAQSAALTRWNKKSPLPDGRKGMGAIEYENTFYLFGGETAQGIDGNVLCYDLQKNTWEKLANKPTPVTDIQAALIGEKIYIPGGRLQNGQATDLLEVYNPRQKTWESKAPLPTPLSAYGLATFEGDLFLFGGKNGDQYSNTVYHYDAQDDRWDTRTPMSAPRAYLSVVVDGPKILVLGGFDGKQALTLNEAYFPTRDESGDTAWESLPPLPQGRYAMGAAHLTNLVYLLGGLGNDQSSAIPQGIQFNLQTNEWSNFSLPAGSMVAYPVLIDSGNFLYLMGGETTQGVSASNLSYQAMYTISVPILQNGGNP
jgi:DNA-binding CsgD family transcriptional regulator